MRIIKERQIKGNIHYDGDVCFMKNCEIEGNVRIKGNVRGKNLKAKEVRIDGKVILDGNLEATEIEIYPPGCLTAKNIKAEKRIDVYGEIKAEGSIIVGDLSNPPWKTYDCEECRWKKRVIEETLEEKLRIIDDIIDGERLGVMSEKEIIAGKEILSVGMIWAKEEIKCNGLIESYGNIYTQGRIIAERIKCFGTSVHASTIRVEKSIVIWGKLRCNHLITKRSEVNVGHGYILIEAEERKRRRVG